MPERTCNHLAVLNGFPHALLIWVDEDAYFDNLLIYAATSAASRWVGEKFIFGCGSNKAKASEAASNPFLRPIRSNGSIRRLIALVRSDLMAGCALLLGNILSALRIGCEGGCCTKRDGC